MFGDQRSVESQQAARNRMLKGINLLADTVAYTMGPKGRNVILQRHYNQSRVTKDGVTVANEFFLKDPVEDIGAQLIKEAAQKTADEAGDGTTTATVLARSIIKQGIEFINDNPNANPIDLNAGITAAVSCIVDNIKTKALPVDITDSRLLDVATISANNDIELGKLVTEAITSVGKDGQVVMEYSKSPDSFIETIKGTVWDQGIISPHFITSEDSEEIELEDPLIITSNFKLTSDEEVYQLVKFAKDENRSILIICEELEKTALSYLLKHTHLGHIKAAVVRPPSVSNMRSFMLQDISIITGSKLRDYNKGHTPKNFNMTYYGGAEKVIVTRKNTVIIGGKGDSLKVEERKKAIEENIRNAEKGIDGRHKDRLSKMFSGVATVYIGGGSEIEQKERRDRVEDSILATKSALDEGILPGGGSFLATIQINPIIPTGNKDDFRKGIEIVRNACKEPYSQILHNAGLSNNSDELINVKTGEVVENLINEGIIDPAKVTRCALENAASVAKMILTTEGVIYYTDDQHIHQSLVMDRGNRL